MARRLLIECDWCENAEEYGEGEQPVGWIAVTGVGEDLHCCSWRCVEKLARRRAEQAERLDALRHTWEDGSSAG